MTTITMPFSGGCACGAIRYESTAEPVMMLHCHCRDCQRSSGGPFSSFVIVPTEAFKLLQGSAFRLTLVAGGCLLLAFPVVFFWRVAPANAAFLQAATTSILPPDWTAWRTQWETGHALRFVLHGIAFVLIAVSLTAQGRETRRTAI